MWKKQEIFCTLPGSVLRLIHWLYHQWDNASFDAAVNMKNCKLREAIFEVGILGQYFGQHGKTISLPWLFLFKKLFSQQSQKRFETRFRLRCDER
jgi:hypothetical protein